MRKLLVAVFLVLAFPTAFGPAGWMTRVQAGDAAFPSGSLRPPPTPSTVTVPSPTGMPPLPDLMIPSFGTHSVSTGSTPDRNGAVPSLTAPGPNVHTTRVVVSSNPTTLTGAVKPALPPPGSIASPSAATAIPPAPSVTSPFVSALVSGPERNTLGDTPSYSESTGPLSVQSAPAHSTTTTQQPGEQRQPRPRRPRPRYDRLPLLFAEMDKYDQIAMEPYKDRYDTMPLGEKAKLYSQQFEFMRGRPPNFDPRVTSEVERYEEASQSTDAIAKRQYLYKPAIPKKRAPRPEERSQALLGALPGPWEQDRPPVPVEPEQAEPAYQEFDTDHRMENLRQGWNAMDVIRGRRQR